MNDLLFYALLAALLYYFFFYLPNKKKLETNNPPLVSEKGTQTETIIETEPSAKLEELKNLKKGLQQKERTIIGLNQSYSKLEEKKDKQITDLQQKLNTITHQLQELKTNQNKEEKDLEKVLDSLLKGIQELDRELC